MATLPLTASSPADIRFYSSQLQRESNDRRERHLTPSSPSEETQSVSAQSTHSTHSDSNSQSSQDHAPTPLPSSAPPNTSQFQLEPSNISPHGAHPGLIRSASPRDIVYTQAQAQSQGQHQHQNTHVGPTQSFWAVDRRDPFVYHLPYRKEEYVKQEYIKEEPTYYDYTPSPYPPPLSNPPPQPTPAPAPAPKEEKPRREAKARRHIW